MAFVLEKTIAATMVERCRRTPGNVAFRYRSTNDVISPKGTWREVTFRAFFQECEQLSLGLRRLGVGPGDSVAILSRSRYEWTLADFAIFGCGGVSVPIYPSSTEAETAHLLEHSEAKIVFVEDEIQLGKVLPRLDALPKLEKIVVLETTRSSLPAKVRSLFDVQRDGEQERHAHPNVFEKTLLGLGPETLFTICYTSGTTGVPKGAMLTHHNLMSVLEDCAKVYGEHIREDKETLLTFLPFSHIIGRLESMSPFVFGWQLAFAGEPTKIGEDLREVRPTILFTVPRIFEKALAEVEAKIRGTSFLSRGIFDLAMKSGESYYSRRRRGRKPNLLRRAAYGLFRETVMAKVLEGFGGRLRFAICGGAPLSKEVGEVFEILGILILEGYGLTETCAPVTMNSVGAHKFGTVGRPLPEVTVKIADDGEILLRSQKIFAGYWKDENETRDAFDDEAWFKTGDIGFIDPQGYLHITDRKKDLLITSGGKNIAPQKIENLAKTHSPLIADFVVVGDRRKHLSALVTLDRKELHRFARRENILYSDPEELTRNRKVELEVDRLVGLLNQGLARFETVKRFAILPGIFTVEAGELTPSLKVKRSVIYRKYREVIDALYQDSPSEDREAGLA
ncbi:MAG: long-chain fatty acid--CoA ligase [Bdellovibrionales bacterium]|nr:long-chain fatty acid--CoA ligase [Bdellovibrionales bacterium]